MNRYTNIELADIHFCYGQAEGNARRARRIYIRRFGRNRRIPDSRTFARAHRNLRENGRFVPLPPAVGGRGRPRMRLIDIEAAVLRRLANDPEVSTRDLANQFHVAQSTIWEMIHRNGMYPYHLQRVQALSPGDYARRLAFCHWFQQHNRNGTLASRIFWTDESQFTRDGINNYHNFHIWANANPHAVRELNFQQRFSLNVWAGMIGNQLVGPFFLPNRLNGRRYRRFLLRNLPDYLDDVPLAIRADMYYMHDGAPPHFARRARAVLARRNYFPNRVIGRGGDIAWPARTPDLNPLDFAIWGHVKSLVYGRGARPNTIDELRQRIIRAFNQIRATPGIMQRIHESMNRRIQACINAQGSHFEQFL